MLRAKNYHNGLMFHGVTQKNISCPVLDTM